MSPLCHFRPLILAAFVAFPALALAQAPKPAATIDGVPITAEELKIARDDLGPSLQRMDEKQRDAYVLDYLIDLKLLARAAEKQKLDQDPQFARLVAHLRSRALMELMMEKAGSEGIGGDKIAKFYEEATKGLPPEEEAKARHILVQGEDEAKKAQARVKGGEDFAKVAAELSKDPGSGKDGGDLGWFTKDRMVKEFADAAFALKPGEISEPVKSQFGWHVIKLEEKRVKPVPPLSEVKDELGRYLVQKAQQDLVLKLRSEAKIERATPEKPAEAAKPAEQPKK